MYYILERKWKSADRNLSRRALGTVADMVSSWPEGLQASAFRKAGHKGADLSRATDSEKEQSERGENKVIRLSPCLLQLFPHENSTQKLKSKSNVSQQY